MLSAEQKTDQPQSIQSNAVPIPYVPSEHAYGGSLLQRLGRGRSSQVPPVIIDATARAAPPSIRALLSSLATTRGVWLGLVAWALALSGTPLLAQSDMLTWAELLLVLAGLLAVVAWGHREWLPAFSIPASLRSLSPSLGLKRRLQSLAAFVPGIVTAALASSSFLAHPAETFGLAGWLWLLSMALLVFAALIWPKAPDQVYGAERVEPAPTSSSPALPTNTTLPTRRAAYTAYDVRQSEPDAPIMSSISSWPLWEAAALLGILALALVLRLWNLADVPYAFNFDEIITGRVAHAYLGNGPYPPVFSTVWIGINLPALWFAFVATSLNVVGMTMVGLRLPAALVGAATVLPFYGMVRGTWGRVAALVGSTILAFSAADIHYSRVTLNNIITPFFWTLCFFFLLRGLRTRRPLDWLLAGMAGGLSEYFYYGTRLLPFVLAAFFLYLLAVHCRQGWRYLGHFALTATGYVAAFGPLLAYFITHPGLYFGRAAAQGVLMWDHIPTSLQDLQKMWDTLWPLMASNLLGFSTIPTTDNMYAGPLLMQAEAALLVLGVALLIVKWRQPAAFLMLIACIGVLFAGGTLIHGTPYIAHWTPAFPTFYAAIAVPVGAWAAAGAQLPRRVRRFIPLSLLAGVAVLGALNIYYYFVQYTPRPLEEVRAAQDRAQAALGPGYRVFDVGTSAQGWDIESMQYFAPSQEGANLLNPSSDLPLPGEPGKGLAFFFYTDNQQFEPLVQAIYPGGVPGEVRSRGGSYLFYTYVLTPEQAQAMYGAYLQLSLPGSDFSQPSWSGQVPSIGSLPPTVNYPLKARWTAAVYVPAARKYRIQISGVQADLQVNEQPYDPSGDKGQLLPAGWNPIVLDATLSGPAHVELMLHEVYAKSFVVPTEFLWPLRPGQTRPGAGSITN